MFTSTEQKASVRTRLHKDQTDEQLLKKLLEEHNRWTGSRRARDLLDDWATARQKFVKVLIQSLMQSSVWDSSAFMLVYDDWGGWFDHVVPPNVQSWTDGTQFRYGSRVGCLVLGPYARRGHISKVLHSHVSLLKFCEATFGLLPLNKRDKAADDMSDCFDFQQPPAPPPPTNPF